MKIQGVKSGIPVPTIAPNNKYIDDALSHHFSHHSRQFFCYRFTQVGQQFVPDEIPNIFLDVVVNLRITTHMRKTFAQGKLLTIERKRPQKRKVGSMQYDLVLSVYFFICTKFIFVEPLIAPLFHLISPSPWVSKAWWLCHLDN